MAEHEQRRRRTRSARARERRSAKQPGREIALVCESCGNPFHPRHALAKKLVRGEVAVPDAPKLCLDCGEKCPKCGGPTEQWTQVGNPTPATRCLANGCTWNLTENI